MLLKNILIIHTGGTIGSQYGENIKELNKESTEKTKLLLLHNFKNSNSPYAKYAENIDYSDFSWENTTLSESMTLQKLTCLVKYINNINFPDYDGIIVLHGTDTLAYTSSLLSFAFANIQIPLFLVSGNRPPADKLSNANENFSAAIELIWSGIAPNVYVTYRNSDGIMRLFLGNCIMQSENYSEDFRGCNNKFFRLPNEKTTAFEKCNKFSQKRTEFKGVNANKITNLSEQILLIKPYTGLDYSVYSPCLKNGSFKAVVHGTYHSGTVSLPGLVLKSEAQNFRKNGLLEEAERLDKKAEEELNSKYSIKLLTDICNINNIPVFISPSFLGNDQYETMSVVNRETHAELLNMTAEAAFAKLTVALSCGIPQSEISNYMNLNINNERN